MVLSIAVVSPVNWSEVPQRARAHGIETRSLREDLESLGVEIVPFGSDEATAAADVWHRGGQRLAMADRAGLATAVVRGCTALTADREWATLDVDVDVIR